MKTRYATRFALLFLALALIFAGCKRDPAQPEPTPPDVPVTPEKPQKPEEPQKPEDKPDDPGNTDEPDDPGNTDEPEDKVVAVTGITLDRSEMELGAGGQFTLAATVTPADATDKSVTWSSSDPAVAAVSDGVVTGIDRGTADITATTTDGGFTAVCRVTVTKEILPESITLDLTRKALGRGTSFTLTATVLPEDADDRSVTWSSSNPAVATVDAGGTVTAIKPGAVLITAATNAGGLKAECAVIVQEQPFKEEIIGEEL